MSSSTPDTPLWVIEKSFYVNASPEQVYELLSDVVNMGKWSPENKGGEWVSGVPGTVGARFVGFNENSGREWSTESEVITAEPGVAFAFSVLNGRPGGKEAEGTLSPVSALGESVWEFRVSPEGSGTRLVRTHTLTSLPAGLARSLEGLPKEQVPVAIEARRSILEQGIEQTVAGIQAYFAEQ